MTAVSGRRRWWRYLVIAAVAALPLTLGGCSLAVRLYLDQVERAYSPTWRPAEVDPLADRPVVIAGPLTVALGPQSALAPADTRYLLDGLTDRLRHRFPSTAGPSTVLRLETIRDTSNAQPAVVQTVVRVYDNRSLQSVIRGPAVAVDLKAADRSASIDELVAGLAAKLDSLLRQP